MALDRVTGVLGDHVMTRNQDGTYDTDRDLYVDDDGHLLALTKEQAADSKYAHNPAAAENKD